MNEPIIDLSDKVLFALIVRVIRPTTIFRQKMESSHANLTSVTEENDAEPDFVRAALINMEAYCNQTIDNYANSAGMYECTVSREIEYPISLVKTCQDSLKVC